MTKKRVHAVFTYDSDTSVDECNRLVADQYGLHHSGALIANLIRQPDAVIESVRFEKVETVADKVATAIMDRMVGEKYVSKEAMHEGFARIVQEIMEAN